MNRLIRITRLGLLFNLAFAVVGGAAPASVIAQSSPTIDEGSYVSELTDLDIEVGGNFVIDEVETDSYSGGESEVMYIEGDFSFLTLAYFDDEDDPEVTRDLFLSGFETEMDSFENVDRDETDEYVWSLDQAETSGVEVAIYIEVVPDVVGNADQMVMIAAPRAVFPGEMEAAGEDVLVDGESPFIADAAEVDDLLAGDGGDDDATPEAVEDDEATIEPEDEIDVDESEADDNGSLSSRRVDARLPGRDSEDEEVAGEATAEVDRRDVNEDSGETGVVSDDTYISPQHGIEITWDDMWFFDDTVEDAVDSDTASEIDTISLTWANEQEYVVDFLDIAPGTPGITDELVAEWTSDEFMAEAAEPEAEILLENSDDERGAVLMRDYLGDGTEVMILREVTCLDADCNVVTMATLIGIPAGFVSSYEDAENGIEADGVGIHGVFRAAEIEEAMEL